MKVGDLVRHKTEGWLAIILNIEDPRHPEFMWCDTGDIEMCSFTLLEIVE